MGSALLNTTSPANEAESSAGLPGFALDAGPAHGEALRRQAAERLAAHRNRRIQRHSSVPNAPSATETHTGHAATGRAAQIAAAVAERYAQTPSYRAFLAAEAERAVELAQRAVQQARAAAEIATLNAQAVAAAQQSLLDSFDRDPAARLSAEEEIAESTSALTHASALPADSELSLWPGLEPASTPEDGVPARRNAHSSSTHSSSAQGNARRTRAAEPPARDAQPAPLPHLSGSLPAGHSTGLTVRLYDGAAVPSSLAQPAYALAASSARGEAIRSEAEARALDEEIAFRQSPVFEEPAGPPMPLPANLIEFPRQLVASRKARPRFAEGPLRDEAAAPGADDTQLRIFEVDPAQISTQPEAAPAACSADAPQWSAIWLDAPAGFTPANPGPQTALHSAPDLFAQPGEPITLPLDPAPLARRALAAAVDGALVLLALAAFTAVFALLVSHGHAFRTGLPLRATLNALAAQLGLAHSPALAAAAGVAALLSLVYRALFFTFSWATPGMRSARIALCTFDDENPTRSAMRRRTLAVLLSAAPLGMGFLWAALDEDRLTWHDRLSHTYQRSY